MINETRNILRTWLEAFQLSDGLVNLLDAVIALIFVGLLAVAANFLLSTIVRHLIPEIVRRFSARVPQRWVDALQKHFVARRSAHIFSALIVYWLVPYALQAFSGTLNVVRNIIEGYVVIVTVIAINALLRAVGDVLAETRDSERMRIQIARQAIQGVSIAIGGIVFLSMVFDISVTVLMSGLAGMAAIIILFFKDSILGFVAGVQLSSNDMLQIGDWIEVTQFGANGTVQDVGLTTVKVQNFDKTISTIPTYALVSESFKNWRGMKNSGARRIKRAVVIDIETIKFLSDDDVQQLKTVDLLRTYLENQLAEIEAYNQKFAPEKRHPPNARGLTNLGTLRIYLENYLKHNRCVSEQMPILVRQLEPSPQGLPLEIYAFLTEQEWVDYERIQSDIFEHILAVLPLFGLKVFQLSLTADEVAV